MGCLLGPQALHVAGPSLEELAVLEVCLVLSSAIKTAIKPPVASFLHQ